MELLFDKEYGTGNNENNEYFEVAQIDEQTVVVSIYDGSKVSYGFIYTFDYKIIPLIISVRQFFTINAMEEGRLNIYVYFETLKFSVQEENDEFVKYEEYEEQWLALIKFLYYLYPLCIDEVDISGSTYTEKDWDYQSVYVFEYLVQTASAMINWN